MLASNRPDVRCRPIEDDDIDAVVDCLRRGFPYRLRNYWVRALKRMSRRPAIEDFPRYGYLLESSGRVVGVLLVIYSRAGEARRGDPLQSFKLVRRPGISRLCGGPACGGGQAQGSHLYQRFAGRPYQARDRGGSLQAFLRRPDHLCADPVGLAPRRARGRLRGGCARSRACCRRTNAKSSPNMPSLAAAR